jgi:CRP/FNR family transcriptional regulator
VILSEIEIINFLSGIEPFKSLSEDEVKGLAHAAKEVSFDKGETLYSEGGEANRVWILKKGRVHIFKYTAQGKSLVIESLVGGEIFGTLCRLGGEGKYYPCSAVAETEVTAIQIPDRYFLECYRKSPKLASGICSLCIERLRDAHDLTCLGQELVPKRIATILIRLYKVHGSIIPFTKREISDLVGTTLETTFRSLSDFQKKGYLRSLRGKIQIENPDGLNRFLDQE